MSPLLLEVHSRWRLMFSALAEGADVSPGLRLRTEGLMEAVALLGELLPEQLQAQMDEAYVASFGRTLAEDFGEQWPEFFTFPQIPAMAKRAPVYPSTAE
jgi:hypothetical protein